MNWKDAIVLPVVVVAAGLLWIGWEAKQTKIEQESAFQLPTSNDRQEYVEFMRELSDQSTSSRNFRGAWHYERAYDSLLEASSRVRQLTPHGEELPRFAALCDVSYRAARYALVERPNEREIDQLLADFESYLSREDAFPEQKSDQQMLTGTLTYALMLVESENTSKDEMLAFADSMQVKFEPCDVTSIQTVVQTAIEGFRNRIRLLGEPYRLVVRTLDGGDLDTDTFRNKVVLIEFWTTTCGPCIAELPLLRGLYQEHVDDLMIIGVSGDRSRRVLSHFVEDRSIPWPQLWADSESGNDDLIESLGIRYFPSNILLDRDGVVVAFNVPAEVTDTEKSLEKWLDEL